MQADNPVEPTRQQGSDISLIDVLREAPTLLEGLPPAALKSLSATCKSLRSAFCARVSTIILSKPVDAYLVRCNTWPQLMMVVCTSDPVVPDVYSGALPLSPGKWEYMMEVQVTCKWRAQTTAVLVRPSQQVYAPMMNLSSQHCAALSGFADEYRHVAHSIILRGPLVTCRAVQSLTHNNWPLATSLKVYSAPQLGLESISYLRGSLQSLMICTIKSTCLDGEIASICSHFRCITFCDNQLDANAIAAIKHANWPDITHFVLTNNTLGKLGIQHIVSCSWPSLVHLDLRHAGIEGPDLACLMNSQWPALQELNLDGNNIDASGVAYLVQGNWPSLRSLILSDQSLDTEAYSLLGIAEADCVRCSFSLRFYCCSSLPQFPNLKVFFCRFVNLQQ